MPDRITDLSLIVDQCTFALVCRSLVQTELVNFIHRRKSSTRLSVNGDVSRPERSRSQAAGSSAASSGSATSPPAHSSSQTGASSSRRRVGNSAGLTAASRARGAGAEGPTAGAAAAGSSRSPPPVVTVTRSGRAGEYHSTVSLAKAPCLLTTC